MAGAGGQNYDQDGLTTFHNAEFMQDPAFQRAYQRGVEAAGIDYNWHWRVHVGLWAARLGAGLAGDFVECGVNKGFMSSAIMQLLDWNTQDRVFFLLDTFDGIDPRYITQTERAEGILEKNQALFDKGFYTRDLAAIRQNFAEWDANIKIIAGAIPDTLDEINTRRVSFLHLDMNCAPPEVAALTFLWNRLTPGAPVLLDDYAYYGYRQQKLAMDEFAARHDVAILSLPTGQGLIIRP